MFLQGYPYAVMQHLLTRRNFLFSNSLKGFWRSLSEISLFHFGYNSNDLKDLFIHILWTLVMSFSGAQAMILTVILTVYQTQWLLDTIWWLWEMSSFGRKRIKEQLMHSLNFLWGSCSFIPQVAMNFFLSTSFLKKPKNNCNNDYSPCNNNCNYKKQLSSLTNAFS